MSRTLAMIDQFMSADLHQHSKYGRVIYRVRVKNKKTHVHTSNAMRLAEKKYQAKTHSDKSNKKQISMTDLLEYKKLRQMYLPINGDIPDNREFPTGRFQMAPNESIWRKLLNEKYEYLCGQHVRLFKLLKRNYLIKGSGRFDFYCSWLDDLIYNLRKQGYKF